jgi:hypothetical protein
MNTIILNILTVDLTDMQKHSKTSTNLSQHSAEEREFASHMSFHAIIANLLVTDLVIWISGIIFFATNA